MSSTVPCYRLSLKPDGKFEPGCWFFFFFCSDMCTDIPAGQKGKWMNGLCLLRATSDHRPCSRVTLWGKHRTATTGLDSSLRHMGRLMNCCAYRKQYCNLTTTVTIRQSQVTTCSEKNQGHRLSRRFVNTCGHMNM